MLGPPPNWSSKRQVFRSRLPLLSAFDFRRAVLAFRAASAAEAEGCVLCQWGEAMALGPNLNSFDEPRWDMDGYGG